jgi:large subunit ribosomal protein L6
MSRIGRKPVDIPEKATVKVKDGEVRVVGPKGELKQAIRPEIKVKVDNNKVVVSRLGDDKKAKALHGLTRTLIANMLMGVTEGWSKTLKLVGTGYRVQSDQGKLTLSLGFSHPVEILPVKGIEFAVEGKDTIRVSGIDKGLVGQVAADIRKKRPPEPYKGKGIRYDDEVVRRKPGKAAKVGAAGFGPGGE